MKRKIFLGFAMIAVCSVNSFSQLHTNQNIFRQLTEELPSPNSYRTASGRPGPDYFQQQVDYVMNIVLDEQEQTISGTEAITYHNNSPETLSYLWIQLDQNIREQNSFGSKIAASSMNNREHISKIMRMNDDFDGGFKIESVTDIAGNSIETVKNHTIMKVILTNPVGPGKTAKLNIKWHYNINNLKKNWGRSGYDPYEGQDEGVYAIAQFYPRLCVYNDYGWQIKQFVSAEFALEFGNFDVTITAPADHIVAATGELQNSKEALSTQMIQRLEQARKSDKPVFIVTEDEAGENEKSRSENSRKWHFKAEMVRDFAFASSRKFIWDAMSVPFEKNNVLAMSFYAKESNPLWSKFSTKTIAHTLRSYSKYTFDYPYPVAQSVDASMGMEYPMIAFNGGRPNPDGSYEKGTRDWVIGVIRHEVGHNYFPMIVNSDERQWQWMDEGFNVFVQGLADRDWDTGQDFSGMPVEMIGYMDSDKNTIVPIMTDADALLQGGMNSYRKPAVGLTILRETILGRELFDQAFREYARTWMFRHPQPADFFRIMEDASGVDLDWFWRGWFFTTEHVDLAIDNVKVYQPVFDEESARRAAEYKKQNTRKHIATIRDQAVLVSMIDRDPELRDKYNEPEPLVSEAELKMLEDLKEKLTPGEIDQLRSGQLFYEISFKSEGGLIMPLIIEFEFEDGTTDEVRIPAEIWMKNAKEVSKVFIYSKEVKNIVLDPHLETADVNMVNNFWPRRTERIFFGTLK
ncbi:MAG: M1 family metallopeptidase [Bacteroidales bacterium]|nr:M1 family metallopeptidase [Bacteroidales bacterium]